jgi:putative membrane protein
VLAIVLLARSGLPQILTLLASAGWALLLLPLLHVIPLTLDSTGWREVIAVEPRPPRRYLAFAAVVREAVGGLLPVARVGSELAGVRLLMRRRVPGVAAGASIVVELTLLMVAQLLFALTGLALLVRFPQTGAVPRYVAGGLLLSAAIVVAFFLFQHRIGLGASVQRLLTTVLGADLLRTLGDPARLDEQIRRLYRDRRRLVACLGWQLAGLFAGAIELWVTMWLLHAPQSIGSAVVVESLAMAIQSATFFVPAGLGTQEGSFLILGESVGFSPELSLALSLARRCRQLLLGVPALVAWFWIERRVPVMSS